MKQTITLEHALALAYFKEGFPYGKDNTVLFEEVSNGGDLEFFMLVLEQFIPTVEAHLEQYELEAPDRLYLFYGEVFPHELKKLLMVPPHTNRETTNPMHRTQSQCDSAFDVRH